MNTNHDISEEAFAAKEREIARLFEREPTEPPRSRMNGVATEAEASEKRIERILARARREPTEEGRVRIGRILTRLKEEAGSRPS